jgi:large subunit ribosomal protein L32e
MEIKKREHPTFARMNYGRTKRGRIGKAWRRPRGHDNKQKTGIGFAPKKPAIGYRQPRSIRGMHPTGFRATMVHNIAEVTKAQGLITISASVGAKKRADMMKIANERKLRVTNK